MVRTSRGWGETLHCPAWAHREQTAPSWRCNLFRGHWCCDSRASALAVCSSSQSQRRISGSFTFQKHLERGLRGELRVVPWRPWVCSWTDTHVWIMTARLSSFPLPALCVLSSTLQRLSPVSSLSIPLPLSSLFLPWPLFLTCCLY